MQNPWRSLQAFPSFCAVPFAWRERTGELFPAFRSLFLDSTAAIAACQCKPSRCPDIPLTIDDITGLELNLPRLGRTLAKTLGLVPKFAQLPPPATFQFGAWSADAVPAILTVQYLFPYFRRALAEVAALLTGPFILVAPTNDFFDAQCQVILDSHRAAFFPLETTVIIKPDGTLHPVKPPGELFAQFTPQPKEIDQTVAQRAFALIQQLEVDSATKPPTPLTVFRLYCIEEMSMERIALKCGCSIGTVANRLNLIRTRTRMEPQALRRISIHMSKMETDITDPRAERINRKRLIADNDHDEPQQ
jgi:hypothetical protein